MYQDDPRGNGILIVYNAVRSGGELCGSDESMSVGFYQREEIYQLPLAGSSHTRIIQDWINEKEKN